MNLDKEGSIRVHVEKVWLRWPATASKEARASVAPIDLRNTALLKLQEWNRSEIQYVVCSIELLS